jgi:hypothetical protein
MAKTFPPLDISPRARKLHEWELLALIEHQPRPVSLLTMMDGFRPRWANDAARRLTLSGDLEETGNNGELAITDAGRATLEQHRSEITPTDAGMLMSKREIRSFPITDTRTRRNAS